MLERYSTPGLRRNEMTYQYKKWQLWEIGIKGEDADKILNDLYSGEWT